MRKFLSFILILTAFLGQAQTASTIFSKTVAAYRAAGTVSASYSLAGSKGSIVMSGVKFRILASDVKSWYDGKTQWTYSKATGEVNVTSPTSQELVMVNPLVAAQSLKTGYYMMATRKPNYFILKLTPKRKSNVKAITLYINRKYQVYNAVYSTSKGATTLKITNYKTHAQYPATTFRFQKSLVPAGTEVIDLR